MNLRSLDIDDIKSAFKRVKAAVLNLSETEQKVREATNNEPWACSTALLSDITYITTSTAGFNEVMSVLYWRLSQEGRTWRNIYKSLVLLDHLLKNGPERVSSYARGHMYDIKACLNYTHIDEKGKDQGVNVRHRAKLVLELLENNQKLSIERQKIREARNPSKRTSDYGYSSNASHSESSPQQVSSYNRQPQLNFSATEPAPAPAPPPVQSVNLFSFDDEIEEGKPQPRANFLQTAVAPATALQSQSSGDEDWADFAAAPGTSTTAASTFQNLTPQLSNCPPIPPQPALHVSIQPIVGNSIPSTFSSLNSLPMQTMTPQQPVQPTPVTAAEMMWSNIDNLMAMSANRTNSMSLPVQANNSTQLESRTNAANYTAPMAAPLPQNTENDDFSQFASAPTTSKN